MSAFGYGICALASGFLGFKFAAMVLPCYAADDFKHVERMKANEVKSKEYLRELKELNESLKKLS